MKVLNRTLKVSIDFEIEIHVIDLSQNFDKWSILTSREQEECELLLLICVKLFSR